MPYLHLALGLALGLLWGAFDARQLAWRQGRSAGRDWHRLAWALRPLALLGLPALAAWHGSLPVALGAGTLALLVFDWGHNLTAGKPLEYVGTVADSDRLRARLFAGVPAPARAAARLALAGATVALSLHGTP